MHFLQVSPVLSAIGSSRRLTRTPWGLSYLLARFRDLVPYRGPSNFSMKTRAALQGVLGAGGDFSCKR